MDKDKGKKGRIIVISGPSGVGKSTICGLVTERLEDAVLSVSLTTRPRAKTEIDGMDYWFVSKEEFKNRIEKGLLLEYAEVFGNLYGTPKDNVDQALGQGRKVILEIDVQGARKVKEIYPDTLMIFIMAPTHKELAKRIGGRGRDDKKTVEKRLKCADSEIAVARKYYEHIVVNDDLNRAVEEIIQIIRERNGDR